MQEQEIITLIDTLYAAFLRGDLNQILGMVSDDTDWTVYGPAELPFTGHFRGKSGAKQFLEALITTQDDISAEFSDRIVQGNRVVILGSYSARIKATHTISVSSDDFLDGRFGLDIYSPCDNVFSRLLPPQEHERSPQCRKTSLRSIRSRGRSDGFGFGRRRDRLAVHWSGEPAFMRGCGQPERK